MEEPTSPDEIARAVESKSGNVEVDRVENGRITFEYQGVVHTCNIPDRYTVVGIGSGWFSIK
jgi:hypothetical protein